MTRSLRSSRFGIALLAGIVALAIGAVPAQAAITTVPNNDTGAGTLADAIRSGSANVTGASFTQTGGTASGVADEPFGLFFPTNGTTFGIMTSGDVQLADDPNNSGSSGADTGGNDTGRGDTARDITTLKIDLNVPQGANCLRFDFQFLSEEFPEYVGSSYNDGFIAELDTSDWTTSGTAISAPNNFAFDNNGNVVSINSSGPTAMNAGNAAGTTYDGATTLLSAATQITPGAHSLYLSIFDQGDSAYDSAAFLDNLIVGFVPNPQEQCQEGAQPVDYSVTLSPASDTNPVGTQHTVTANVTDDSGDPAPGKTVFFQVSGANSTSGTGVTDANGDAEFTYTGNNAGDDAITACVDEDDDGTYCEAGEATASATKTWEAAQGIQGWMAGEGRLSSGSQNLDYAYILDCDPDKAPRFKGKRNSAALNVSDTTSNTCTDDPNETPAKPSAPFDTMEGSGTGKLGSTNVIVEWEFVDGGVDGNGDSAAITIRRASDSVVLFQSQAEPIPAFGGGTRAGRNTANPPPCPC